MAATINLQVMVFIDKFSREVKGKQANSNTNLLELLITKRFTVPCSFQEEMTSTHSTLVLRTRHYDRIRYCPQAHEIIQGFLFFTPSRQEHT